MAARRLAHQAFPYASAEELVAAMAPFARAGLDRGDAVFVAAKAANLDALRAALGADADRIELHETVSWFPRPAARLDAFRRMVDDLPLPELRRTTPAIAPPDDARELPLTSDGRALRRGVAEMALQARLPPPRVDDVVLAASEVAANALRHGRPPAYARAWVTEDELICQVMDAGPGAIDALAGWLPSDPAVEGGWGLPLARRLCDAMEIIPVPGGTLVSLHVSRP